MAERNWLFVTASYVITWLTLIGYLLYIRRAARIAGDALRRAEELPMEVGK